jgi:hypothetical protein
MSFRDTMVGFIWRGQIAVGNAATGTNLLAAMRTAGYTGPEACAVKISGKALDGTDRSLLTLATARTPGAALVASDFTTHGEPIASGVDYANPADMDASLSNIRAPGGATVAQVIAVW